MYVIQNTRTGTYIDGKLQWRSDINNGKLFKTIGAAQNFIQHTYKPWLKKHRMAPPEESLEIVVLKNAEEKAPLKEETVENFALGLTAHIDGELMKSQFHDLSEIYNSLLQYADQERNDVLHKIELGEKLNAAERATLFKRLREVLIYRRQCKDMVEYLRRYEQTGILEACVRLDKANREFAEHLQNRTYKPRILMELFESDAKEA